MRTAISSSVFSRFAVPSFIRARTYNVIRGEEQEQKGGDGVTGREEKY